MTDETKNNGKGVSDGQNGGNKPKMCLIKGKGNQRREKRA